MLGSTVILSAFCALAGADGTTPVNLILKKSGKICIAILTLFRYTGSQPALPMTRAFTVSDGTGNSVGYRLVGTMSFDSDRQHYTAKIMIDDQSFRYDGMYRGGALVPLGSLDMMCVPDSSAVMWVYHRTSSIDATVRSIEDAKSTYEESLSITSSLPPPSPAATIVNTPPQIDDPVDLPEVHSAIPADTGPAPFPLDETPPLDLPDPNEWCYGCRKSAAGGDEVVLHCADCGSMHHLKCALAVNPNLDPEMEWYCSLCSVTKPVAWSNDLLGEYLMFQSSPAGSFYAARVAGITSGGMIRMEWYPDNVFDNREKPTETEFVCSREECAMVAAKDPDLCYDKSSMATQTPLSRPPLTESRQFVIDIILATGTNCAVHPIIADYQNWMLDAPQSKETRHADDFARTFSSMQILPGDASLINVHGTFVLGVVAAKIPESFEGSPESFRQRAMVLASILFQLVILRLYLRRPNQDDVQIYFLARNFTRQELQNITADDPFAEAKRGKVTRHLTVPEAVLQAPEDSSGDQPIPLHFCKTDILVRKTAAARIPAGFWLATAYRCQGQEYSWELTDPISRKEMETPSVAFLPHERGSSPLSDAPSSQMDLGPLVQGEESLSHSKKGLGGLKRRREFDLEEEDRPGSRSSTTVDVGLAVPPCSTDYKWFPLLTWA
ncbi:hypothetical protein B0H14DRAFT_3594646 [Mycena olivaceomarginata]|nr:hypothetical protein B0H14DRAFT_3594646 [Mycena olivaceomarginata]